MYVIKRDGREEPISITKLIARLKRLTYGFNVDDCDPVLVARTVFSQISDVVTSTRIDDLAAEIAISMSKNHSNYDLLAARIAVSSLHKNTNKSFSETIKEIYKKTEMISGEKSSFIADDVFKIVMKNAARLDSEITYDRDFGYDYFGFIAIKSTYLLRIAGNVVERPQHMLMRVCVGIHKDDIDSVIDAYHFISQRCHASLAFFTALHVQECDVIRKSTVELGIFMHNQQTGLYPMLNVLEETTSSVDQERSKLIGNYTVYLELWRDDFNEILDVRTREQEEHSDLVLVYALWIPELFVERIQDNGQWSLFSTNEYPDLVGCRGEEFETLYRQYEKEGKANKVISARKLWIQILNSQICADTPYILFKEASNCFHLSELVENSDKKNHYFDLEKLPMVTSTVAANMKRTIDFFRYLDETVKRRNFQHNIPIAIGVQCLAKTFILLGIPFDSPEGWQLSKYVFESIRKAGTVPTFPL